MSNNSLWAGSRSSQFADAYSSDVREPGARRKKLATYWRAANELRQTFGASAWSGRREADDDLHDMPGAFPGSSMTSNGDEQLVIFPSYARRHVKRSSRAGSTSTLGSAQDENDGPGDQDFWRQQWDQHEDDNAVVDVDVRGWIYAPHRGPPTRKHRLIVGLARQVSGIAAPRQTPTSSNASSRAPSPVRASDRFDLQTTKHEEKVLRQEAEKLVQRGETEAQYAGEGAYSENPATGSSTQVADSGTNDNRLESPLRAPQRQGTWSTTSEMSQAELVVANNHMLTRLQPFLANPLCNIAISAFFYNDKLSRQKTVETDTSGHFNFRAALDFVPTHVRVLASERLSKTEEILITEPRGVSVISDIDDTIKHSAIASGAKEIFKNVFVREFGELSIKGVKPWYRKLAELGCKFHYVSNSPWQLYPVLTSFFAAAGLPAGSFHLKQYSGMLQGIFEPVAERKKGTLEKIFADFPERRFILVGDSGEADLEVYTDVVHENPGRILGVFIRDVTTSAKSHFFDPAQGPLSGKKSPGLRPDGLRQSKSFPRPNGSDWPQQEQHDPYLEEAIRRSLADQEESEKPPALPPRRPTAPAALEEDLIDLDYDDHPKSTPAGSEEPEGLPDDWLRPPPRPTKPKSLSTQATVSETRSKKPAPPLPRKPSASIRAATSERTNGEGAQSATNESSNEATARPDPPPQRLTRRPVNNSGEQAPLSKVESRGGAEASRRAGAEMERSAGTAPPPPPPPSRKPLIDETGPARSATTPSGGSSSASTYSSYLGGGQDAQISRKEEAWMRRWAKAKDALDRKGVMLRSWRVGGDVEREATALVERALRQDASRTKG